MAGPRVGYAVGSMCRAPFKKIWICHILDGKRFLNLLGEVGEMFQIEKESEIMNRFLKD